MSLTRVLGCFIISIVLTSNGWAEDTPYGPIEIPFELKKVPDAPVYFVIGQSGVPSSSNEGHTSNAGFVVTDKGVVVYDALGTPVLGYKLLAAIRSVTDKPVAMVVAGHYHADHIYGLQPFRERTDAEIWAQRDAALYLNGPSAQRRLEQRREALFPWVNERTELVRPDRTFEDTHSFDMGDVHIDLVHIGPAHAPDDTVMIVREHGVVFAGDLIFVGRLPFLAGEEVNTRNWLKGLDHLQNLQPAPRFVIPGHGAESADAAAVIGFTRDYIQFLYDTVGKAAEELLSFEEAYQATDWSRYRDVPTFDAANRRNAYHVYLEHQAAF